jgi:phosphotransferase system HPr (HPr) family protein
LLPKASSLAEHAGERPATAAAEGAESATGVRLTLINPQGLHARPAAQIALAVGSLTADVAVEAGGRRADATSSLELLTLGAGQGAEITVTATGADAARAIDTVRDLVLAGFGELEAS